MENIDFSWNLFRGRGTISQGDTLRETSAKRVPRIYSNFVFSRADPTDHRPAVPRMADLNLRSPSPETRRQDAYDKRWLEIQARHAGLLNAPSQPKVKRENNDSITSSPSPQSETSAKKPRKSSNNNTQQASGTEDPEVQLSAIDPHLPDFFNPQQPGWYQRLKKDTTRGKGHKSTGLIDQPMSRFRGLVRKCQDGKVNFDQLSDSIHEIMLLTVTAQSLYNNFMLHNKDGLPAVFCPAHSKGVTYPYHVIADAMELYQKWYHEDFDPDLFRGIVVGTKADSKLKRAFVADKLDKSYALRLKGSYHGNQNLSNGQWWPRQICLVRDGAHNSMQGGISGKTGEGAYSCILSGGYADDKDEGDQVWYCGTDSRDGEITGHTLQLMENIKNKLPVRLIRSDGGHNAIFKPEKGYRYDGLYDVLSCELLDLDNQRHRFRLVRQPGQDPIRCSGSAVRPTAQELKALSIAIVEKAFLV